MVYLLGSIILTSYLTLSFKVLERLGISAFQAIVFNYLTCVVTGSVVHGSFPLNAEINKLPWLPWAAVMGAVFISLFNLVGYTAVKVGVSVTTVANKLSLVIPFLFSIYVYGEPLGLLQLTGVIIAMFAVFFTCIRRKSGETGIRQPANYRYYLLPVIIFFGSGLLDTMIKYVEQAFLNADNYNAYLVTAFTAAGMIGMILLAFFITTGRQRFSYKSVLAGIAIGIPNYFSIWCLLKVLKENPGRSAAVIPVNNMGIVLFSALVASLAFNEKLSTLNWFGIFLSIISIALIAFT